MQPTAESKSPGFLTKLVEASLRNGTQRRRIGFPSYSSERVNPAMAGSTHSMNCVDESLPHRDSPLRGTSLCSCPKRLQAISVFQPTIFTNSIKQACKNQRESDARLDQSFRNECVSFCFSRQASFVIKLTLCHAKPPFFLPSMFLLRFVSVDPFHPCQAWIPSLSLRCHGTH